MPAPLRHLKILDLSRILAGPFATQLLADLGAEVLKIEPPQGDPTRRWGPPFDPRHPEESAYFRCANRGKKGLVLDFDHPGSLQQLQELLRQADVLVENFLPTTAERLGLTWDQLHAAHPKLILASIRGFASDVSAHHRPGYDFIIQAESGWMSITGDPHGSPMKVGIALVDVLTALYLSNGIQAALLHRDRTGEALHVEVPLMEAALAALVNVGAGTLMTGQPPERYGNAHPHIVPYQTFGTLDGDIALAVGNDRQFEILALWAGLDLHAHPQWLHNDGRVQDRKQLIDELSHQLARLTCETILTFCSTHAIPASQVRTVEDVLFHQAGHLHQLIHPLYDPERGQMVPVLASPIQLNHERVCSPIPPPPIQRPS